MLFYTFLFIGATRMSKGMARNVQVPDTFVGVFSSGSWSHDTRMAYDKIVAMLNKLPAAGGRLRNADDEKVNAESVKAVKALSRTYQTLSTTTALLLGTRVRSMF